MTSCEYWTEYLDDFLDGTLDASHVVDLTSHLGSCTTCEAELHSMQDLRAALKGASVPDVAVYRIRALNQLRSECVVMPPTERIVPQLRFVGATAVFAAIMLAVVISTRPVPTHAIKSGQEPAQARPVLGLPSASELDEMASLHAAHSISVTAGNDEEQETTLAEANAGMASGGR